MQKTAISIKIDITDIIIKRMISLSKHMTESEDALSLLQNNERLKELRALKEVILDISTHDIKGFNKTL